MTQNNIHAPYIIVLGTIQDGGFTSPKSQKKYCKDFFEILKNSKKVSSIAIVDPTNKQQWIIDASPDFKEQLYNLQEQTSLYDLDGILLTHAHIGHYLGLAYLGKEALNTEKVKVFCMKRMLNFLSNNGPWDQLIKNNNISLSKIKENQNFELNKNIQVIPFTVPHRDEYSETVCFLITSKQKKFMARLENYPEAVRNHLLKLPCPTFDSTPFNRPIPMNEQFSRNLKTKESLDPIEKKLK